MAGPSKVLAVYWTGWNQGGAMTNVDTDYNVIYPFAATRAVGTANLRWDYGQISGLQACRARGQKVCLSTGGAGQGISFNSRTISQQFVTSFIQLAESLGGVDGCDYNTFEAEAAPNLPEYQWISAQLRQRFGSDFFIQSPPAPWSARDKDFCRAMLSSGSMDFVGPQYYDGPGLADRAYIVRSVNEWVRDVAGGDASKIIVGFGIANSANYMTTNAAVDTYREVKANHPNIRGAFLWERSADANAGWPFANAMGPLVGSAGGGVTPPVTPGQTVKVGSSTYPYKGNNLARGVDDLVSYTRTSTQIASPANQWGTEAAVVNGKVTSVSNRISGAPPMQIPEGGLVLSGHGAAQQFLDANARVGATAVVPGAPTPEPPKPEPETNPYIATSANLLEKHNLLATDLRKKGVV
jgi:chitinase